MTTEQQFTSPMVYSAIVAVQGALAKTGISKDRKTTGGGTYMFRGIDDVYSHLAPLLAEHGLCVIPRAISRECAERESQRGGALFYTTVHMEFDFVSAIDGSKHTASTFGEAMDSSDKSTNKAMSAAYKYAAFQTFCIPVNGDNDTENANHEVAVRGRDSPAPPPLPFAKRPMTGVHKTWTALKSAIHDYDTQLRNVANSDELELFLASPDAVATKTQMWSDVREYINGGELLPDEFEPIAARVERLRAEFSAARAAQDINTELEPVS